MMISISQVIAELSAQLKSKRETRSMRTVGIATAVETPY
jgi:hypothetical protein